MYMKCVSFKRSGWSRDIISFKNFQYKNENYDTTKRIKGENHLFTCLSLEYNSSSVLKKQVSSKGAHCVVIAAKKSSGPLNFLSLPKASVRG